jgi:hypothetical protein
VACEDRLASLWRAEEGDAAALAPRTLLDRLAQARLVFGGRIGPGLAGRLTDIGREEARVIVRSHRLWEAWLGRHVALPLDHLHPPAEWIEHHLGAEVRGRIAADLDGEEGDPHGRDIPPEGFPSRPADVPAR